MESCLKICLHLLDKLLERLFLLNPIAGLVVGKFREYYNSTVGSRVGRRHLASPNGTVLGEGWEFVHIVEFKGLAKLFIAFGCDGAVWLGE